jgi:hypothetical protein
MALPIIKELKGIIRIDTSDNYTFVLPYSGATPTPIQNSQAITNVEEVWIIVEDEGITINPTIVLPQISTFNGGWNVKIYVVNKGENPIVTTPRQEDPTNQDFINFGNNISVPIKSISYFHIADNNLWACWKTL